MAIESEFNTLAQLQDVGQQLRALAIPFAEIKIMMAPATYNRVCQEIEISRFQDNLKRIWRRKQ